jgi:hypothetical protein
MVLFSWRPLGWRWLTNKQENIPKFVTAIVAGSIIFTIFAGARPELHFAPGIGEEYYSRVIEAGNNILDDEKIGILARRRQKMIKDKAEAEEYFAREGYKPRPTNQFLILNDNLGY